MSGTLNHKQNCCCPINQSANMSSTKVFTWFCLINIYCLWQAYFCSCQDMITRAFERLWLSRAPTDSEADLRRAALILRQRLLVRGRLPMLLKQCLRTESPTQTKRNYNHSFFITVFTDLQPIDVWCQKNVENGGSFFLFTFWNFQW